MRISTSSCLVASGAKESAHHMVSRPVRLHPIKLLIDLLDNAFDLYVK